MSRREGCANAVAMVGELEAEEGERFGRGFWKWHGGGGGAQEGADAGNEKRDGGAATSGSRAHRSDTLNVLLALFAELASFYGLLGLA